MDAPGQVEGCGHRSYQAPPDGYTIWNRQLLIVLEAERPVPGITQGNDPPLLSAHWPGLVLWPRPPRGGAESIVLWPAGKELGLESPKLLKRRGFKD